MKLVADLQLHSKYSRAVSKDMVLWEIYQWAKKKGIGLVATGDWMHAVWFREIASQLEEAGEGLYKLKQDYIRPQQKQEKDFKRNDYLVADPKFLLSAEISSIYKQGGRSRRVHTLVFSPSLGVAEEINKELLKRGCNLASDGRPIVGLSAREIAEIALSEDDRCLVIPAHVWTPWYSLYGSKSGFDSVKECFGDVADRIFAVETGLSSDPAMNWRVGELERRAIVSFSDAHSGPKLGREATVFEFRSQSSAASHQSYDYRDIYWAIAQRFLGENKGKLEIACTIEFYPEEGKYHYTGHRKCDVIQSPDETRKLGKSCHVCGKPLTVGVMHRVEELSGKASDSDQGRSIKPVAKKNKAGVVEYYHPEDDTRSPYVMMVPLLEIISEVKDVGVNTKTSENEYMRLVNKFGSEFAVLLQASIKDLAEFAGERMAKAVDRVRKGKIKISPGYDGVFGEVKIWSSPSDSEGKKEQMSMF